MNALGLTAPMTIDATLQRLSRQPFRAKFQLRDREAATVALRGMQTVREHAEELLATRLAPAERTGRQADAVPRSPRVRCPARHRDLLPDVSGALARDPQGARAHERGTGLRRGRHLPL